MFANSPRGRGSIPDRVIPKTQKLVFDAALLNTQHYKVRIKGKVEQSREWVVPSLTPRCSSYWKGASGSLSTKIDNFFTYLKAKKLSKSVHIYLYIYIYPSNLKVNARERQEFELTTIMSRFTCHHSLARWPLHFGEFPLRWLLVFLPNTNSLHIIIWLQVNYNHHHHVVPQAQISLILSRHFFLSFIASGRSSGPHPVSCWMYVRARRPAFARPYVGVHRSTSLMSSFLLHQQCPACLVRLTWIVFVMGGRWPYSWCLVGCCRQDLFNTGRSILV